MGSSTRRPVEVRAEAGLFATRECPTLSGHDRPLIEHRIGIPQCLERQRGLYHKCHRCVFRGAPVDSVVQDVSPPNGTGANGTRRNGTGSNGTQRDNGALPDQWRQ